MPPRTRSPRRLAVWGLLLGLLLAAGAAPALAHDDLVGTDPADGAVVESLPEALTLTFSAPLLEDAGAIEIAVADAAGRSLTAGDPVLDGVQVTQPLSGEDTGDVSGSITVQWRAVSGDGHPISGEYAFSVGEPSATEAPAPGEATAEFDPTALLVIAAVLVSGVMVVLVAARKRASRED